MIRVSIGDNDFNFIMQWVVRYCVWALPQYIKLERRKSKVFLVKETIQEFLEGMKVEKKVQKYILSNLKVSNVRK